MTLDDQPDRANQDTDRETDDENLSRLVEHPEAGKKDEPAPKGEEENADEESWPSGFGSFP